MSKSFTYKELLIMAIEELDDDKDEDVILYLYNYLRDKVLVK